MQLNGNLHLNFPERQKNGTVQLYSPVVFGKILVLRFRYGEMTVDVLSLCMVCDLKLVDTDPKTKIPREFLKQEEESFGDSLWTRVKKMARKYN